MTGIRIDDLWPGELASVVVKGEPVLLVRLPDGVRAYRDRCAHQGVRLSEGKLEGQTLTCRAHHWQYDLATGACLNPRTACLEAFDVRVEAGMIVVDVESGKR